MSNTPSRSGRPSSGRLRVAEMARAASVRSILIALALAVALTVTAVPSVAALPAPSGALADPATPNDPAAEFEDLMGDDGASAIPGETATDAAGTSSTGQAIVDFAMQFYGSPYVYAGNTPAGFDCSGFTQYVVLNVTGLDIGHGTEGQLAYGTPVS